MRHPLVVLVLLSTAAPAIAHAQLGRLTRAVAREAGVPGTSDVKTGDVAFGGAVLEITEARMRQLLVGLDAESDQAKVVDNQDREGIQKRNDARRKQHEAAMRDYEKKVRDREKCMEPFEKESERTMASHQAQAERDTVGMQQVADRIKAAQGRGDMAEIRRLSDSLVKAVSPTGMAAVRDGQQVNSRALEACGEGPIEPESPEMEPELDYSTVRAAGVRASGMSGDAYAMMRERVVTFVATNGKSSGGMTLTSDEVAVLKAALDQLKPYKELLQGA